MTRWEQFKDISIEDLFRWLEADEQLLKGRKRLLDAIPECPRHGHDCVPHAVDWIESVQALVEAAQSVVNGASSDIYHPGCTCSACTRRARLADKLAPFETPDAT